MTPKLYIELNPMSEVPDFGKDDLNEVYIKVRIDYLYDTMTVIGHEEWEALLADAKENSVECLGWTYAEAAPVPAVSVSRLEEMAQRELDKRDASYGDCETADEHAHAMMVLEQLINEAKGQS